MDNLVTQPAISRAISVVLDSVADRTRRDYGRALTDFMEWHAATGADGFNRATVNAYTADLKANRVGAINQRLAAIRKLARELWLNDIISHGVYEGIRATDGIKTLGSKVGQWLSIEQAQAMLDAPDTTRPLGLRDRAILAIMLGCGLRRNEAAGLVVEQIQQRDGRWIFIDIVGKHNRIRSVPMAPWVKVAIDAWRVHLPAEAVTLFCQLRKGNRVLPRSMNAQTIWRTVEAYRPPDVELAPHDLRRTFARMAYRAGMDIRQIQLSLGHASIQTTETYIGAEQDLQHAPSDAIPLHIR